MRKAKANERGLVKPRKTAELEVLDFYQAFPNRHTLCDQLTWSSWGKLCV